MKPESRSLTPATYPIVPLAGAPTIGHGLPTLGELLVADGVVTERQLQAAVAIQAGQQPTRRLGEILVEERMTSEQRIQDTVKAHGSEYPFGSLLVLLELLTPAQLDACLVHQQQHPGTRIGEVALRLEFVAERQLLLALSYHFDRSYIEPDITLVDMALLKRLPVPYLKSREAIPVFTDGSVVTVVTPDPSRMDIVKDFESSLRMPVELAIGPRDAIMRAIADYEHFHKTPKPVVSGGDDNVVAIVDYLFAHAIRDGASDIHIEPMHNRVRVRFRIDGELVHRTDLPAFVGPRLASRIKVLCNGDLAERRKHQGGRILYTCHDEQVDMRVSIYVTVHGENIVIRLLHKGHGVLPIERLGMLPALLQRYKDSVLEVPTGVVLFTGPTGSGDHIALPLDQLKQQARREDHHGRGSGRISGRRPHSVFHRPRGWARLRANSAGNRPPGSERDRRRRDPRQADGEHCH